MRRRNNDYEILTAILFFALVFIFTFIMLTGFGVRETVESETPREAIRLERLDLNTVPRSAAFDKHPVRFMDDSTEWSCNEKSEPEPDWFTEREADIVAAVIYHEAGCGCTDRHMELVGAVVKNRKENDQFPDTIEGVVLQKGQYQSADTSEEGWYMTSAKESDVWEQCRAAALVALRGEVDCPPEVVFQANFKQGHGVYECGYTSYSVTYFCYI